MSNRCLYCYQPIEEDTTDFHTACSKKFFGTTVPLVIKVEEYIAESILISSQLFLNYDFTFQVVVVGFGDFYIDE